MTSVRQPSLSFRGWPTGVRVLEWDAITGVRDNRTASIMIPSRLGSVMTASLNVLLPSCSSTTSPRSGLELAESAISPWLLRDKPT